jgi:hypothetical protein
MTDSPYVRARGEMAVRRARFEATLHRSRGSDDVEPRGAVSKGR